MELNYAKSTALTKLFEFNKIRKTNKKKNDTIY